MSQLGVLLSIAIRNLFTSGLNLVIGAIIFLGTLLLVVGGALLDSVDSAMGRTLPNSVIGHVQVYSADADELTFWGDPADAPRLGAVQDFSALDRALKGVDNVEHVVPMGLHNGEMWTGNILDRTMARLRKARSAQRDGDADASREVARLKPVLRQMISVLQGDIQAARGVLGREAIQPEELAALERANSESFWNDFEKDPFGALEFLENRVAPLVPESEPVRVTFVGADMERFSKAFERMKLVEGQLIPPGERGLLLTKLFYDDNLRLKVAQRLELLKSARAAGRTIASDPELAQWVGQNKAQAWQLRLQIDEAGAREAVARLQRALGTQETDFGELLVALLDTTDANFDEHYRVFHEDLAPRLELYQVRVGEPFTIKSYDQNGLTHSVTLKVYGLVEYQGMERFPLAANLNLVDLVSFRELYGHQTPEQLEEMRRMVAEQKLGMLKQEDVVGALFSSGSTEVEATTDTIDEDALMGTREPQDKSRTFTREELEKGVAVSAAVLLRDPSRLDETMEQLREAARRAGLEVRVASWRDAAGLLGQFVTLARLVLFVASAILFVVALIFINNAIMMAMMRRVQEIGTLRAIGAQRSFVLSMVLLEVMTLGLFFGGAGCLVGWNLVTRMGREGLPAGNDVLYFLFSGPRLHPSLALGNVLAAFLVIGLVSVASAFYPALMATRISPLRAMQSDE
jgi:ABC-type lipoprotein release transport system permease subunit